MKPALTPEEWAHREKWGAIAVGSASDPRPHALAALALHGQSFGFDHADVRFMRHVARFFPHKYGREQADALAARIEALLPPEAK